MVDSNYQNIDIFLKYKLKISLFLPFLNGKRPKTGQNNAILAFKELFKMTQIQGSVRRAFVSRETTKYPPVLQNIHMLKEKVHSNKLQVLLSEGAAFYCKTCEKMFL